MSGIRLYGEFTQTLAELLRIKEEIKTLEEAIDPNNRLEELRQKEKNLSDQCADKAESLRDVYDLPF